MKGKCFSFFVLLVRIFFILFFFKVSCFLSYRRGVHLSNPFYSVWASESRSKVAVSFKYLFFIIKSNLAVRLPLTSKLFFFLSETTYYLHYCGRDFCLPLFLLPVSHGVLCVQNHWWENATASCNARDSETAL